MKTTTSRKKKITNRRLILLAATLLFLQIVILMSLAFYQGFDLVSNRFSEATLDVLLLENQYDLTPVAERENIVPNKQVHKDPRVHNIEQTDAFVFLKITVPVVCSIKIALSDSIFKKLSAEEKNELSLFFVALYSFNALNLAIFISFALIFILL